ncbi:unnamed protein product [Caenorhabditis angaria]|uniref:BTB domain-containing protein n=1 Tax=Caenorhabditis angaria TaxID=860376 RepID=A0A9P1I7E6_9PELO|nr:unnamed protein product [Caenorhabditis angaria]
MSVTIQNGCKMRSEFVYQENNEETMNGEHWNFGGHLWKISADNSGGEFIVYINLERPTVPENDVKTWTCHVEGEFRILKQNHEGGYKQCDFDFYFNHDESSTGHMVLKTKKLERDGYLTGNLDRIVIEIHFDFKFFDFSKNIDGFTDLKILLEDSIFYFNKALLISQSKYFFEKNDSSEIRIDEKLCDEDEFCCFLVSMYNRANMIDYGAIRSLAKLALIFQAPAIMSICEDYEIRRLLPKNRSDYYKPFEKFKFCLMSSFETAEKYGLELLMQNSLTSFENRKQIREFKDLPEYAELKETTKKRIFKRYLNIL